MNQPVGLLLQLSQVAFRSDVKLVNEGWDFQAYVALRKTGKLTLLSWLQSLRGAKPAIWAWDDPLPMILSLGSFLRRVCSKLGTAACRPFIRSDRSEPRQ